MMIEKSRNSNVVDLAKLYQALSLVSEIWPDNSFSRRRGPHVPLRYHRLPKERWG